MDKRLPARFRPAVEALEDRQLLSCNVISGYVYHDANANGIRDPGEPAIANASVELRNNSGQVVASAVTDASGFYEFDHNRLVDTSEHVQQQTLSFSRSVNGAQTKTLAQFDPGLGQLTGVDLVFDGSITSRIKVENFNIDESSHLVGTVSGNLSLSGPGITNLQINPNVIAGEFDATPYDGVTDYGGTSGVDFGSKTASASSSRTLTDQSVLSRFQGTGTVSFTLNSLVTSSVDGNGDEDASIRSTMSANVRVVYHYIPSDCLQPGSYTIHEIQPANFLDGRESLGNTVLPLTAPNDFISVTLTNVDSINNNFGEVLPASLSGCVFLDRNNNGHVDADEPGLAGFAITLTGTDDLGSAVLRSAVTNSDGRFSFSNLRPGTYALRETQLAAYSDGIDMAGTAGGLVGNDLITSIVLRSGMVATDYCFAERGPAGICGFVYYDANDNGIFDSGETPIPATTVSLLGYTDQGPITQVTQTGPDGSYCFTNLRPGTYGVTETQPAGYNDGKDAVGSLGGILSNDRSSGVVLNPNDAGVNYNFGETLTSEIKTIFRDCPPFDFRRVTIPAPSKGDLLTNNGGGVSDATLTADATFVDGLYRGLLHRDPDAGGLLNWVRFLASGGPRLQVMQGFWYSPEHRGIQVDDLYSKILGRAADAGGRAYFTNLLVHGATEDDVSAALLTSGEFQANSSDLAYVNSLYRVVLARDGNADPNGQNNWLTALRNGASRTSVANAFVRSAESYRSFVTCVSKSYLAQDPNPNDVQVWVNQLLTGQFNPDTHSIAILASDPVFNRARVAAGV